MGTSLGSVNSRFLEAPFVLFLDGRMKSEQTGGESNRNVFSAKSGVRGLSVKGSADCTCPHHFWLLVAADMASQVTSLHTPSSLCVSTLTWPYS